tara:strand:+ start:50 stop:2128 length:2079 start_codon:yes stop_codon:yes gene_type:complete
MSDALESFLTKTLPSILSEAQKLRNKEDLLIAQNQFKQQVTDAKNAQEEKILNYKNIYKNASENLKSLNAQIEETEEDLADMGIIASNLQKIKVEDQTEGGAEFYQFVNTGLGQKYNRQIQVGNTLIETLNNSQSKVNEAQAYLNDLKDMQKGIQAGEQASRSYFAVPYQEPYIDQETGELVTDPRDITGDQIISREDVILQLEQLFGETKNPNYAPGTPYYEGYIRSGPVLKEAVDAKTKRIELKKKELDLQEAKYNFNKKVENDIRGKSGNNPETFLQLHNNYANIFGAMDISVRSTKNSDLKELNLFDISEIKPYKDVRNFSDPVLLQTIIDPVENNMLKILREYGSGDLEDYIQMYDIAIQSNNLTVANKSLVNIANTAKNNINNRAVVNLKNNKKQSEIKMILKNTLDHYIKLREAMYFAKSPTMINLDSNIAAAAKGIPISQTTTQTRVASKVPGPIKDATSPKDTTIMPAQFDDVPADVSRSLDNLQGVTDLRFLEPFNTKTRSPFAIAEPVDNNLKAVSDKMSIPNVKNLSASNMTRLTKFDEKSGKLKYDIDKSGSVVEVNQAREEADRLATEAFKQIAGGKGNKEEYFKSLFGQFLKDNNIKGYTDKDVMFFVNSIKTDINNNIDENINLNTYTPYPQDAFDNAGDDIFEVFRLNVRTKNNAAYNKYAQIMDLFRQYLIDVL